MSVTFILELSEPAAKTLLALQQLYGVLYPNVTTSETLQLALLTAAKAESVPSSIYEDLMLPHNLSISDSRTADQSTNEGNDQ